MEQTSLNALMNDFVLETKFDIKDDKLFIKVTYFLSYTFIIEVISPSDILLL